MICPRCAGYVYVEKLASGHCDRTHHLSLLACLNCGFRTDATMERNKQMAPHDFRRQKEAFRHAEALFIKLKPA